MPGFTEMAIVLVIVLLVFGTSKLKTMGSDLGTAIKGFRKAVSDDSEEPKTESPALETPETLRLSIRLLRL